MLMPLVMTVSLPVLYVLSDLLCGRSRVQDDQVAIVDQSGSRSADALLLISAQGSLNLQRRVDTYRLDQYNSAMSSAYEPVAGAVLPKEG